LEKGADPNAKNASGLTPLHKAVDEGHVEIAKLLLERGADPTITNEEGLTPLDLAKDQRTASLIRDFINSMFRLMIIGLDYSELTAGKWCKIYVKVKGNGKVSLKLEGDLDYVAPEETRLSGISSIEVFVKPRTSGELPLKVTVESSGVRNSKVFLLRVKEDLSGGVKALKTQVGVGVPRFPPELLSKYEPLELIGEGVCEGV